MKCFVIDIEINTRAFDIIDPNICLSVAQLFLIKTISTPNQSYYETQP
jgi:hypothetical protein